jgi:hypothetical protein
MQNRHIGDVTREFTLITARHGACRTDHLPCLKMLHLNYSLQQQCQVCEWRDSALCCATVRRLARDLAAVIITSLMLLLVVLLLLLVVLLLVLSLNLCAEYFSTHIMCTRKVTFAATAVSQTSPCRQRLWHQRCENVLSGGCRHIRTYSYYHRSRCY